MAYHFPPDSLLSYYPPQPLPPTGSTRPLLSGLNLDYHTMRASHPQAPTSGITGISPSYHTHPAPQPPSHSNFTFKFAPQMNIRSQSNTAPSSSVPSTPSSSVSFAFSAFNDPRQRQPTYDSDGYDSLDDDLKESGEYHEYNYERSRSNIRPTGACAHCKSLKVRCKFDPGESSCQRCQAGKHDCVVRGRKKRKPAPTHEALLEKSHRQDATIQSILLQFDQMKTDNKVRDWIDHAQSVSPESDHHSLSEYHNNGLRRHSQSHLYGSEYANGVMKSEPTMEGAFHGPTFFDFGASALGTDQYYGLGASEHALPEVVKRGLLQAEDIGVLFDLFFNRVNPFFSILDQNLHTPDRLIWTSPFLFTVVCTVASRYYDHNRRLYPLLMEFARDAAGKALVAGGKTVDTCQAYLLLAVYPKPRKWWSEDRSWTLMGLAIRLAIELGVNQPPAGPPTPETLNRTRTWLNCFCVDASHATQYGKLPMVRLQDDYVARQSREWWRTGVVGGEGHMGGGGGPGLNLDFDIHLCGYVDILLLMARFRRVCAEREKPDASIVPELEKIDRELNRKIEHWYGLYQVQPSFQDPICRYRGNTTRLITAYSRLVVLSLAFQLEIKARGLNRGHYVVQESVQAAQTVLSIMMNDLYPVVIPTRLLRFAMDAHFLYVSFAAAFLLNLLRPKCLPLLDMGQQQAIVRNVQSLIEILGSEEVALDGRHSPALYSRFLSSLLNKYNVIPQHSSSSASTNRSNPSSNGMHHSYQPPADNINNSHSPTNSHSPASDEILPQYSSERDQTPPHMYFWPDTSSHVHVAEPGMQEYPSGTVYQQTGDADMDFSMTHFLQTVVAGDTTGVYAAQYHDPVGAPSHMGAMGLVDDGWEMAGVADQDFGLPEQAGSQWLPPHVGSNVHGHGHPVQFGGPWPGLRS